MLSLQPSMKLRLQSCPDIELHPPREIESEPISPPETTETFEWVISRASLYKDPENVFSFLSKNPSIIIRPALQRRVQIQLTNDIQTPVIIDFEDDRSPIVICKSVMMEKAQEYANRINGTAVTDECNISIASGKKMYLSFVSFPYNTRKQVNPFECLKQGFEGLHANNTSIIRYELDCPWAFNEALRNKMKADEAWERVQKKMDDSKKGWSPKKRKMSRCEGLVQDLLMFQ